MEAASLRLVTHTIRRRTNFILSTLKIETSGLARLQERGGIYFRNDPGEKETTELVENVEGVEELILCIDQQANQTKHDDHPHFDLLNP